MQRRTLEDIENEQVPFSMDEFIAQYELTETREAEDALDEYEEKQNGSSN